MLKRSIAALIVCLATTACSAKPTSDLPATVLVGVAARRAINGWIEEYGGWIDRGVRGEPIDCRELVRLFDSAAGAPIYSMPAESPVLLWAHDRYRESIAWFHDGARDLTGHCREWIAGTAGHPYAGEFELTRARASVTDAAVVLHTAIAKLEGKDY